MEKEIEKIIKSAGCVEEVWETVEERFGDEGLNYLYQIKYELI